MIRSIAVLLALSITLGGCAATAKDPATAGPTPQRGSSTLITSAELDQPALQALSLYDAIQRLRPTWLRQRGATSVYNGSTLPQVMINEAHSSMDALAGIRAADATSVEFMSGTDATTQYGTGYTNGVIKVKTGGKAPR